MKRVILHDDNLSVKFNDGKEETEYKLGEVGRTITVDHILKYDMTDDLGNDMGIGFLLGVVKQ